MIIWISLVVVIALALFGLMLLQVSRKSKKTESRDTVLSEKQQKERIDRQIKSLIAGNKEIWNIDEFAKVPESSGIYMIYIKNTDGFYIGQAKNISKRWKQHRKSILESSSGALYKQIKTILKANRLKHNSIHFKIIEKCDNSILDAREKFWINKFKAATFGLNSQRGNNIIAPSEQTLKLIDTIQKGKWERVRFEVDLYVSKNDKNGLVIFNHSNNKKIPIKQNDYLICNENPQLKQIKFNSDGRIENLNLGLIPKETFENILL